MLSNPISIPPSQGLLTFRLITATDMPSNALGIKGKAYVEMKIGTWVKSSSVSSVNSRGQWAGPITTPELLTTQIEKDGIKMKIISKSTLGGTDTLIGQTTLSLAPLLCRPSEWVDIKGQLSADNKFSGKYTASGMFVPPNSSAMSEIEAGDTDVPEEVSAPVKPIIVTSSSSAPVPVPVPVPTTSQPRPSASGSGTGSGSGSGSDISAEKLAALSGMFEGVQKQNQDLQAKVGGLEKGIKTQLNQVRLNNE